MKKLYGVVTPMITPMDENGNVDYASLETLTKYLIAHGSNCLYPCGTTGAVTYLTIEERKRIVETVVKAAEGKAVVYAQVGGLPYEQALELAKHAYAAKVDGIGLLTPTYYKLSDDELFTYYTSIAMNMPEDFPIYMYAIPSCAGNDITPALAARIAEKCPNIIGIKYSVPDILSLLAFRQINDGKFSVMVAGMEMFYPALCIKCDGIVSGNCHVFTEQIQMLYSAFQAGDHETALRIQNKLFQKGLLTREREMAKCVAYMYEKGAISHPNMRAPMQAISAEEAKAFCAAIDGK